MFPSRSRNIPHHTFTLSANAHEDVITQCGMSESPCIESATGNGNGQTPQQPVGCCRKYCKQLTILVALLCIITYIVVDQITKPCDGTETEVQRMVRLEKASAPLTVPPNNTTNCNANITSSAASKPSHVLGADGRCHFRASCVSVVLEGFVRWVGESPALGGILLAFVYMAAVVLLVPASILTLGAGAAFGAALGIGWGTLLGSIAVVAGASMGAIAAFFLGRFVIRGFVSSLIQRYTITQAIDAAIRDNGMELLASHIKPSQNPFVSRVSWKLQVCGTLVSPCAEGANVLLFC